MKTISVAEFIKNFDTLVTPEIWQASLAAHEQEEREFMQRVCNKASDKK